MDFIGRNGLRRCRMSLDFRLVPKFGDGFIQQVVVSFPSRHKYLVVRGIFVQGRNDFRRDLQCIAEPGGKLWISGFQFIGGCFKQAERVVVFQAVPQIFPSYGIHGISVQAWIEETAVAVGGRIVEIEIRLSMRPVRDGP